MKQQRLHQISKLLLLAFATITCCSGFTPSSCSSPLGILLETRKGLQTEYIHPNSLALQQQSQLSFSSGHDDAATDEDSGTSSLLGTVGIVCQPIVWISLGFVATTGAGLPAGPFGLLGAVEGLSYLVVVGLAAFNIIGGGSSKEESDDASSLKLAQKLSSFTLFAALLTLLSLVKDQGCVPNAKPILDYSGYLPVCNPEDTPGLFGL